MHINSEVLRQLRVKQGLSMNQLAKRAGLSATTISEIEAGNSKGRPATCKRLADALGVDVEVLWVFED